MSRMNVEGRKGFTLVELAVVIVIIGVLAAFGVPRFLKSVERSKASEAFAYLSAIRASQERYVSKEGVYAKVLSDLDITQSEMKYFTDNDGATVTSATVITTGTTSGAPSWTLTLKRDGASSSYGDYTVTFTQDGFDASNSTICDETRKDISPLSGTYSTASGN